MKEIYAAFVKSQKQFGPALKTSTNPHFRTKYADLSACIEAVIGALNDNGIAMMQLTHEHESGILIETIFIHESGEQMSAGKLYMPATKMDAQGFGSALSYARRYSLMAACGIAPEDDDANSAVKNIQAAPYKATPKPAAPPVPAPKAVAAVPETNAPPPPPVPKPIPAPVENTAPPAPPKMQGRADQWQLKVSADPGMDFAQWTEVVTEATVFMLEMAQTKDDTMNIFRTNRNIYDKLQADDVDSYNALTNIFKSYKEKL
jgi:hypothetical protein